MYTKARENINQTSVTKHSSMSYTKNFGGDEKVIITFVEKEQFPLLLPIYLESVKIIT